MRRADYVVGIGGLVVVGLFAWQPQQVNWSDIRERIQTADSNFREVRYQLEAVQDPVTRQSMYPRQRVEGYIRGNQERIVGTLPLPTLRGLRDHVNDYSQSAIRKLDRVASPRCPDCVTVDSTKVAYEFVSGRNAAVAAMKTIEVNLVGTSNPSEARLQLLYVDGALYQETTTRNELRVYRGNYDMRVTRSGFTTGVLRIDLISNPGTTLHCDLAQSGDSTCRQQ